MFKDLMQALLNIEHFNSAVTTKKYITVFTFENYHLFCINLINLIFLEDSYFSGYKKSIY